MNADVTTGGGVTQAAGAATGLPGVKARSGASIACGTNAGPPGRGAAGRTAPATSVMAAIAATARGVEIVIFMSAHPFQTDTAQLPNQKSGPNPA